MGTDIPSSESISWFGNSKKKMDYKRRMEMRMSKDEYNKWVKCNEMLKNGGELINRELKDKDDYIEWSKENDDILNGIIVIDSNMGMYHGQYDEYKEVVKYINSRDDDENNPLVYWGNGRWSRCKSSKT